MEVRLELESCNINVLLFDSRLEIARKALWDLVDPENHIDEETTSRQRGLTTFNAMHESSKFMDLIDAYFAKHAPKDKEEKRRILNGLVASDKERVFDHLLKLYNVDPRIYLDDDGETFRESRMSSLAPFKPEDAIPDPDKLSIFQRFGSGLGSLFQRGSESAINSSPASSSKQPSSSPSDDEMGDVGEVATSSGAADQKVVRLELAMLPSSHIHSNPLALSAHNNVHARQASLTPAAASQDNNNSSSSTAFTSSEIGDFYSAHRSSIIESGEPRASLSSPTRRL